MQAHPDWRQVRGRYIKDPRLGHRLGRSYPGGEITDTVWNLCWLGTDQDGLVHNGSPVRAWDLSDRSYFRVFLFGGSTVMGLGVTSNADTLAAQLERMLQQRIPHARVANCGVGSYMSWQELSYLSLEMIGYAPDMIIALDGHNDFVSSTWGNKGLHGDWIPNTHRSLDDICSMVRLAQRTTSFPEAVRIALRASPPACWWRSILSQWRTETSAHQRPEVWGEMDPSTWSVKRSSIEWYGRNVRSFVGIARAHRVPVAYILQPSLTWSKKPQSGEEQRLLSAISERMPPIPTFAPQWHAGMKPVWERIVADLHDPAHCWIEDGNDWLDTVTESTYHDWVHYNALGQRLLAERLAVIVQRLLERRERSS